MPRQAAIACAFLMIAPTHLAAQAPGPSLPRFTAEPTCPAEGAADSEEIVVCGRRNEEDSPYRVPRELRDAGPIEDRHAAWGARVRDEQSLGRFSDQTVGPFGYLQRSRQMDCEWRAARQIAQGRQPDCTMRVGPDQPTDWQRR